MEIGGVNSVIATSPNSTSNTPYSVIHAFNGEDFASDASLSVVHNVVHYSSEETFAPQTPVSDSTHFTLFPTNETYTTTSHSNAVFTSGTPLPSPGAHYVQANMDVEETEEIGQSSRNAEQLNGENYVIQEQNSGPDQYIVQEQSSATEGYMVREQNPANEEYIVREQTSPSDAYIVHERQIVQEHNPDDDGYIVQEENPGNRGYIVGEQDVVRGQNSENEGYIVQEQTSPGEGYIVHEESPSPSGYMDQPSQNQDYISSAQSSERGKSSEDLTLPTMVVFTTPENDQSTASVRGDAETRDGDNDSPESNLGPLRLRQRCESTSIGQFAPPSIIFQVRLAFYSWGKSMDHSAIKQTFEFGKSISAAEKSILNFIQLSSLLANYCKCGKYSPAKFVIWMKANNNEALLKGLQILHNPA